MHHWQQVVVTASKYLSVLLRIVSIVPWIIVFISFNWSEIFDGYASSGTNSSASCTCLYFCSWRDKTTCTFSESSAMLGSSFPPHDDYKVFDCTSCTGPIKLELGCVVMTVIFTFWWTLSGEWQEVIVSGFAVNEAVASFFSRFIPTFLVQGFCLPCHQICPVSADTNTGRFRCPFLQT